MLRQEEVERSVVPLPPSWSAPTQIDDVIDADGLELRRAGMSSRRLDVEAVGAAADWASSPRERSYFELLERVAVLDACPADGPDLPMRTRQGEPAGTCARHRAFPISDEPARWAYARSNGVAIQSDWDGACTRAEQELIERDRVMRAWLGDTVPRPFPFDLSASPLSRTRSYRWRAYAFPDSDRSPLAPDVHVVGMFGFPVREGVPLVFGYAARSKPDAAVEAAMREAVQLLAFLWGEDVPQAAPALTPTPLYHLETFQCRSRHEVLSRWLEEGHRRYRRDAANPPPRSTQVDFVDLTPGWLAGRFRVAKALCDAAIPLTFGQSPMTAHLPEDLRVHPIP
jgi:hypothetical protein